MRSSYKFIVSFSQIEFYEYFNRGDKVSKSFNAQLTILDDRVQMEIYFTHDTYFDTKFRLWLQSTDNDKAGRFFECSDFEDERLTNIDLSDFSIIGEHSSLKEDKNDFIAINVYFDGVKLYWRSHKIYTNSAYFLLDDNGFDLVKEYYNRFEQIDYEENKIELIKYKDIGSAYQFHNIHFIPEFNLVYDDKHQNRELKVVKKPLIKIVFENNITESEIRKYAEDIRLITSFYMRCNINYLFSRIYIDSDEIFEIKFRNTFNSYHRKGFSDWGVTGEFHQFMATHWQGYFEKNRNLLAKIIPLFNQSILVDEQSKLLIRYSLLETCISYFNKQKGKSDKKKFEFINKDKNWENALHEMLKSVKEDEKNDFTKRWYDIQRNLENKPMHSELNKFLSDIEIDVKLFPITFKKIKEMRDDLSHGSIESINLNKLQQANIILYGIIGDMILRYFGVKEQKLERIIAKAKTIQDT